MAKNSLSIFSLLLLALLPLSLSSPTSNPNSQSTATTPPLTAHAELTNHGFPIGLLPTDVKTYTLNATTGDFTIHLGGDCKVTLPPDNYLATYSKRVTGKIVNGRIAEIDGIRVRAFFQWWSITGIRSNAIGFVRYFIGCFPESGFTVSGLCDVKFRIFDGMVFCRRFQLFRCLGAWKPPWEEEEKKYLILWILANLEVAKL
ncbi:hypothetical protein Vadar_023477 [Vaccinium darrowii]|uniref:Uncharacterized protein n=1 Tax=Vaccinium darrowii TaxID=229202 RepID=A0ACB7Y960_9ERIC|nr:hypothetical protein Vadar_023477 [Vaccinium darrowii]